MLYIPFRTYTMLFALLAASCVYDRLPYQTFRLEGTVTGDAGDRAIYLSYPVLDSSGVWYEHIDTAVISDGRFRFEGQVAETTPALLFFDNAEDVALYLEPTRIRLQLDREHPYDSKLSGTSVDWEVAAYRKALHDTEQLMVARQRDAMRANERWVQASESGAPAEMRDSLWAVFYEAAQTYMKLLPREDSLRLCFVAEHPDYAVAPSLLQRSARVRLAAPERLAELYAQLPESSRKSLMGRLAGIQIGLYDGVTGPEIGNRAADFLRKNPAGEPVRLSDCEGAYVLLDFWASWCGPCLKAVPKVREAYERYAGRGLRIIGISADDDRDAWLQAIETHGLSGWPQVLSAEQDPAGRKPCFDELYDVAACYDVRAVPCFILIDPQGLIAARWDRLGPEQFDFLDKHLR